MHPHSIPGLEGLTNLAGKRGVDIRPTLLRVLTDLYVQKPVHSPEEEQHYTELALRLFDEVEVPVRAAVASRLAAFAGAPPLILRRLARDVPDVAAAVLGRTHVLTLAELIGIAEEMGPAYAAIVAARPEFSPIIDARDNQTMLQQPDTDDSSDTLSELFFAAGADERRLIILNIDYAPIAPAEPVASALVRDPARRLEQAALLRDTAEFTRIVETCLGISHAQAKRIVEDRSGETIVVAAKALGIPTDALQRILLFLNPAVGQSVQRVYDLSDLYEQMTQDSARRLLAIWQDKVAEHRPMPAHRPIYAQETLLGPRRETFHPRVRPAPSQQKSASA
jgi:hypothetical protein